MPQMNFSNVPGPVSAQSFQSNAVPVASGSYTAPIRAIPQKIVVSTNGTTEVNVFSALNPFSGTLLGAKIVSKDDANGNITLQHTSAGTTVFTIAKGSAGAIKGSYFAPTAFGINGTMTVKSSTSTGNALVELDFVVSNPALPGAQ